MKEEDDDIIRDSGKPDFDSKKFKKQLESKKISKFVPKKDDKSSEVIDVPNDPFFLVKYRSFHNHDLDCNYVEHAHLVMEEDLHKKGSINLLPQS